MVAHDQKIGGIHIYGDIHNMNEECVHYPLPTLFLDEILENVGRREVYSFTNGFLGYQHVKIMDEDRNEIMFMT